MRAPSSRCSAASGVSRRSPIVSLAAAIQAPVFHVNGDDAEAVIKVADIAARYRQEFNSDVFVDMVCYRRHGHNEGDDPKFTQPHMYALIEKHPNPRELYTNYLIEHGEADAKEFDQLNDSWKNGGKMIGKEE